jgi:hypothetical protein
MVLHRDLKTYSVWSSQPQAMSDETAARLLGRTPVSNSAWEALEIGNRQWEAGEKADALATWETVGRTFEGSDAALAALSHLGQAARLRGDNRAAIIAYTSLIACSDPPKRESRWGWFDYSNYKHNACIELSDMYILSDDSAAALKYADLARNVHQFSDMCGTAVISEEWAIQERIKSLRQAIALKRSVQLK